MILPKAGAAYDPGDEQRTRHAVEQADKFNLKTNRLGDGVADLLAGAASGSGGPVGKIGPAFTAPGIGVATGTALTLTGDLSAGGNHVLQPLSVAGVASTNYAIATISAMSGLLLFVRWNQNSGMALVTFSDAGAIIVLASNNAAGGNSCFDTANFFGSNGANGIGMFGVGGLIWIQPKTSYSGGTVRVYPFGG